MQDKLEEFMGYVTANLTSIPNYADRHRQGEPIATGFVESAVNQVVSKRLVKRQQMRWTPSGAHRLLQVRIRVLNKQLRGDFERWHPRLQSVPGAGSSGSVAPAMDGSPRNGCSPRSIIPIRVSSRCCRKLVANMANFRQLTILPME